MSASTNVRHTTQQQTYTAHLLLKDSATCAGHTALLISTYIHHPTGWVASDLLSSQRAKYLQYFTRFTIQLLSRPLINSYLPCLNLFARQVRSDLIAYQLLRSISSAYHSAVTV